MIITTRMYDPIVFRLCAPCLIGLIMIILLMIIFKHKKEKNKFMNNSITYIETEEKKIETGIFNIVTILVTCLI